MNGKPLLLAEGLHVRNTRLFHYGGSIEMNKENIKHGTINILRIPQGHYAKVIEANVPKLLTPGNYVIDSALFTYSGLCAMNEPFIQHETIKIIRVGKGQIGLTSIGTKQCLLPEGLYTFNDQNVTFSGLKSATDNLISHPPITRFRVNLGEIGLGWWKQSPILIQEPGVYEIDSIDFNFEKCVPVKTKLIVLGSTMRIVVYEGEVGVTYKAGKLDILGPGTFVFDELDRVFESYMSTKLMSIPLIEDVKSKEPFLRCDTRDFVEVGIRAAVSFRIADPKLTLLTIGNESATIKLIKDNSIAALQSIVRSTALNQLAQSKTISASDLKGDTQQTHNENGPPSAPQFFENLHDEFLSKIHDSFKKQYGILIDNIRIEDFQIMNQELANNISKQAIITAETSTKLANLEAQREIELAGQERLNSINSIKATAEAFKLKTETEAKNSATIILAETKAIEIKTLAKAKAEALTIEAEAEAKAIEIKALAEKKRAEYLSSTEFGKQEALLTKHHDMVIQAMKSVSQVVYLPSDANMGCLPLQMFGLQGNIPTFDSITQSSSVKVKK